MTSTFGGGYRPGLVTVTDPLSGQIEYLASERYRVKRAGMTIAAALIEPDENGDKIIHSGDVMVLLTAGDYVGQYLPYNPDATGDAAGAATAANAKGHLFAGDMNVRWGDTYTAGLLIEGSVLEARIQNLDAATKAALLNYIQYQ